MDEVVEMAAWRKKRRWAQSLSFGFPLAIVFGSQLGISATQVADTPWESLILTGLSADSVSWAIRANQDYRRRLTHMSVVIGREVIAVDVRDLDGVTLTRPEGGLFSFGRHVSPGFEGVVFCASIQGKHLPQTFREEGSSDGELNLLFTKLIHPQVEPREEAVVGFRFVSRADLRQARFLGPVFSLKGAVASETDP